MEYEGWYIYPIAYEQQPKNESKKKHADSIWLKMDTGKQIQYEPLHSKIVVVVGIFRSGQLGQMGMFPAEIQVDQIRLATPNEIDLQKKKFSQ